MELGRLGDQIPFIDLPFELPESEVMAAEFGGGAVVCGSPFEVANDPFNYGGNFGTGFDLATDFSKSTSDLMHNMI